MDQKRADVTSSQRPLRVLIVEDSPTDAEMLVAILKRAGYALSFDVVDVPEQFAQHLADQQYDLILSDHNLLTWTGLDALATLRQSGKDIPFIAVTASLGDEAAAEYFHRGATDYVLKHRLERLPDVISRALREKAFRDEAARLQERIFSAKREWELTFDSVPDVVLILDERLRIQRANRAAARLLGLEFSQIIGKRCCEVVHGEQEPYPACPYQRMLLSGVEERADIEDPRLGRVFDVTATPLRDSSGAVRGCIEVLRDVTQRRHTEEALRGSEASYRALFENASLGIYRSTRDGRLLTVNPALLAMLGYDSREELLSKELGQDVYSELEDRERLIQEYLTNGTVCGYEVQWKRKDGKPITVRLSVRGISGPQDTIEEFEGFVEDITARRAIEKQFYAAQKFEAIGQLAGGIAHDFNNVLGAILGWAELSEEMVPADSKLRKGLRIIIEQARRATGLTRQLLAFARRQHMEPQILDLNASVEGVVSLLGKVIGSDIELRTTLADTIASIRADPTQIEQVVMNLCLNARDAMPHGGQLRIDTRNVDIDEEYCRQNPYARPGSYVQLAVSDTGVGMDAATIEHIFEPFFTTKEVGKGTGLGLATVYGVVKQHNGFVHVYSEVGQGTTFRVYFPAEIEAPRHEKKREPASPQDGTETILFAEDNEDLASLVREALTGMGYTILWAPDGEEAVRLFQANQDRVALVFLDVVMPRLNGPDAYLKICSLRQGIPALFSSGHTFEAPALRPLVEHGAQILQKPYSVTDLARRIREVLEFSCLVKNGGGG
jgi:PAS domain S-box-containing protein